MKYIERYQKSIINVIMLISFLVIPHYSFSQSSNTGSLTYLNKSNGFGNLFLGEDIKLIAKDKLTYMDDDSVPDVDSCLKYEYKGFNQDNSGDDLDLDLVGIRTYKNKIISIYLFFNKEAGYHIFQSFLANYGKYTERVSDFTYNWDTDGVKLFLEFDKQDVGIAIFSCKSLYKEIERNKDKQIAVE